MLIRPRHALVLALAGIALAGGPAAAGCNTSQQDCQGRASFTNRTSNTICYLIRRASGEMQEFCLPPLRYTHVNGLRFGDRYCYRAGTQPPLPDCALSWINIE